MKGTLVFAVLAVGVLQFFAVRAGFHVWFEHYFIGQGILFLVVAFTPILGTVVGMLGARGVWHWNWLSCIALFWGPYIVAVCVGVLSSLKQRLLPNV